MKNAMAAVAQGVINPEARGGVMDYSPDICPACGSTDFKDAGEVCTIVGDIATPVGYAHACKCGAYCEVIDEDGWDWFMTCPCGKRPVRIFEDYQGNEDDYLCRECQKPVVVEKNSKRTREVS